MSSSRGHSASLEENARNELNVTNPALTSVQLGCFSSYMNTMLIIANPSNVSQGRFLGLLACGQEGRIWVTHQHQLPFLRQSVTAMPGSEKAFSQEATPIFLLKSLSKGNGGTAGHSTYLKEMEIPPHLHDDSSDKVHPTSFDN